MLRSTLSSPAVSNKLEDLLPSERSQFNSGSAPSPSYPVTTTTQPQSTSTPSSRTGSRNDLFFTTTPQISRQTTPEPRDATPPPPLPLANASPSTPAIRISRPTTLNLATPTRTSSFYDLLPVIPTSLLRIDFASANEYMTIDHVSPIQEAFDDSNDPLLDRHRSPRLRLSPQNDFQLGEGRHASVYMASLIPLTDGGGKGEDDVEVETGKEVEGAKWKVCHAKRLLPDRESQAAGLGEAFMLSKLASAPSAETASEEGAEFILKLYGIKDERDGVESVPSLGGKRISGSSGVSLSRRSLPATSICPTSLRPPLGRVSSSAFPTLSTVAATPGSSPHLADNRELPPPPEPPVELSRTSAIARRDRRPRYSEPPLPTITTHTDGSGSTPVWPIRRKSIVTLASSPPNLSPASLSPTSPAFQPLPPAPRIILLLEYCPFGHLLSFLKNYPERVGERRWIEWAIQLAKALVLVHERGILHADIKPQNILIAKDLSVRLADFGMAMFVPPLGSLTDALSIGIANYSPPEFVVPAMSFSFPSDVFSLGVTLGVMISGVEPFAGMRTVERMFSVSKGGYYTWEERRRMSKNEGDFASGGSLSRASSTRSARSNISGVPSTFSNSGAYNLSSGGTTGVSGGHHRLRSDSIESMMSLQNRDSDGASRSSWTTAALISRLLVDEQDGSNEHLTPDLSALTLPPSPTLSTATLDATSPLSEPEIPIYDTTTSSTYEDDGAPLQYFLNGSVVNKEIRRIVRMMTQPIGEERPTAKQVLEMLLALSI